MKKALLDSSFAIEYLRGKPHTKRLMDEIRTRKVEAYLSIVSVFELYVGAMLSQNSERRMEDAEAFMGWFEILPLAKETMRIAAQIYAELRRKGKPIGIQDIFIAATALSHSMPLATMNKKHFQNVQGLVLL